MAYSRMHLEIKTVEGNIYPTGLEDEQVSHNASVMLGGYLSSCVRVSTYSLAWDIRTSVRWKRLQFLSLRLWTRSPLVFVCVPSVLPLPARCVTNRTGPILHGTPSWPRGAASVIATLLLLGLRAVVSQANASLEVEQRVFHLKWDNREKNKCFCFYGRKCTLH